MTTAYFLDTSALIKRYVYEIGSALKIRTALVGFEAVSYTFVSADNRLLEVARSIDLSVINPNDFS